MPERQITIARRERTPDADPLVLRVHIDDETEDVLLTLQPVLSEFVLLELAAASESTDPVEAGQAFFAFLGDVLEPESVAEFKALARREKWNSDDLLPFVQEVIEYMTARPTERPSDSQDGPQETSTLSKVVSLSDRTVAPAEGEADTA